MSKHSPGPWRWGWYDDTSLIDEDALCADNGAKLGVYSDPDSLSDANAALIAAAPRMLAMLEELEWAAPSFEAEKSACPSCDMSKANGHAPDCRLAALLSEVRK